MGPSPVDHDCLGGVDDDVQHQNGAQIKLELLVRNHGVASVQLPLLEEKGRPVEFRMYLQQPVRSRVVRCAI